VTKRAEAKEAFLGSLRSDLKEARKCLKGKPCGGRCIPQDWNCRLLGEGDTPPTRGNLVKATPELRAKIARVRQAKKNRALTQGLKSAALLAGAGALGASMTKRGVSAAESSRTATTVSGMVSALNPGLTLPATMAAIGITLGARGQEISSSVGSRQKSMREKLRVLSIRNKALGTRIKKKQAQITAEKNSVLKIASQLDDDKLPTAQRQRLMRLLPLAESRLAKLQGELAPLQQTYGRRANLINRGEKRLKPTVTRVLKATTQTVNIASSTGASARSERMRNRRNLGLTGNGRPGPKPRSVWQENWMEDAEQARSDKACGKSFIAEQKKCVKPVVARKSVQQAQLGERSTSKPRDSSAVSNLGK